MLQSFSCLSQSVAAFFQEHPPHNRQSDEVVLAAVSALRHLQLNLISHVDLCSEEGQSPGIIRCRGRWLY